MIIKLYSFRTNKNSVCIWAELLFFYLIIIIKKIKLFSLFSSEHRFLAESVVECGNEPEDENAVNGDHYYSNVQRIFIRTIRLIGEA